MMSAIERTAVSVTIDGRTERGPDFIHNIEKRPPLVTNHAEHGGTSITSSA